MMLENSKMRMSNVDSHVSGWGMVRSNPTPFGRRHSAFTLVELLVVITIIGILSTLLLGVAARASENAREARTKSMIAKIHGLVMEQYDSYKDRRAPVSDFALQAINNSGLSGPERGLALAEARLYALRELMLLEMPDRWSDVLLASIGQTPSPSVYLRSPPSNSASLYGGPTPINEAYRRRYFAMVDAGVSPAVIATNQGAECLYMMVMIATADGEARSLFNESSIGDTDGDGAYEFLDGWGNPISFIRWPVGFESDRQLNARNFSDQTALANAAVTDHDPMDPFVIDLVAFRTMPLIFSAGSDERFDIYSARDTTIWPDPTPTQARYIPTPQLTPYEPIASSAGSFFLGTPMDESGTAIDLNGGADNIHNHNITGN